MLTQQDSVSRIVALVNLQAMVNSTDGEFWIEKVTRSRVWVGTSVPVGDGQWGGITKADCFAVLPCYPSSFPEDANNPRVVLDPIRFVGADSWDSFLGLWELTASRKGLDGAEWATYLLPSSYNPSYAHVKAIHAAYHAVEGARL